MQFTVFVRSGFCSVVSRTVFRVFPDASLYVWFYGLLGDVLQYCFYEFIFSLLIAAWYFFFPSMYWFFLLSPSFSLFIVLWDLTAFVLFLIVVRASVHHGTDFPFAVVFGDFRYLLHVDCIVSSIFSINTPMSFCPDILEFSFSSVSVLVPSSLSI